MVKLFVMAKRKKGISQEECLKHWLEIHAPLILKTLPGIRKYVQNHALQIEATGEPPFDGMAELWFDDLDSWRKAAEFYLGSEGKVIREDEEKFLDLTSHQSFVCQEKMIKD
jgi:uncharacterized protein (TIGR02118 family)